jgi:hypothetical protein
MIWLFIGISICKNVPFIIDSCLVHLSREGHGVERLPGGTVYPCPFQVLKEKDKRKIITLIKGLL